MYKEQVKERIKTRDCTVCGFLMEYAAGWGDHIWKSLSKKFLIKAQTEQSLPARVELHFVYDKAAFHALSFHKFPPHAEEKVLSLKKMYNPAEWTVSVESVNRFSSTL